MDLLQDFADVLRPRLAGDLRTDAMTRALYATDASLYQVMPVGVVLPKTTDDVQAALEAAARFGIPVLPRGGGSSLAGQAVNAALVVDFSRDVNGLLEVNVEERWARVEPGLVLDVLNNAVAPYGLMVGPDPAPSNRATLGGMLGNNATGTHSLLYGNLVHHVRAVEGFLADGTPFRFAPTTDDAWDALARGGGRLGRLYRDLGALLATRGDVVLRDTPRHWRRNSGYRVEHLLPHGGDGAPDAYGTGSGPRNLARLLAGSEGTLGVVTAFEVGLVERPARTAIGVVHFETRQASLEAVMALLETDPSAVELFDGGAIAQTRKAPGYASRLTFLEGDPGAVQIVEYFGTSDAEFTDRLDRLERAARAAGAYAVVRVTDAAAIRNVWSIRKEGLGLIMGVKGDHKPVAFIEDASVPPEHLAAYIDDLERVLAETGTRAVMYAHASAGCLHIRPFLNTKDLGEVDKMTRIARASADLVGRYGGAVSSEHGDGRARSWLTPGLVGPELYGVYREVKRVFDPENRLNPGNIVDAPPMDRDLRLGPTYETIGYVSDLDFSEHGGFEAAVELCNGNGACRKLQSGTMCPSFMVTREEQDSTRGRANALRNAMSGALPPEELTGDRMYEVMDLCIQCKACKTECPSNVDMAKIKTEWLARYWEANGMPLRARLFANLPILARRLRGPAASVVNWTNRRAPVRRTLAALGIAPERTLPPFAPESFSAWFAKRTWRTDGPEVLLFADTFHNFNHPEVARAAALFLDRTGHTVRAADPGACCGRPMLSKGALDPARALARRTVDALAPYAERGVPVVGLEPSCILTFRDEFLALLPGDASARRLAEVTRTFEEFVAERAAEGAFRGVRWKSGARRALLHGHCHQKALVGLGPSEACLRLAGYEVDTVDSGCCGMAGAFGYEREHYDVSLRMAERRLAPAVRAADPATAVAAAGTSCRAQIEDTTGRHAKHPAELLLDALAPA